MEYDWAKQLKDAGFPQHKGSIDPHYRDAHADFCTPEACVPTLEELIEACPKHRKDEYQTGWVLELSAREDGTWTAGYVDDKYGEMADELEEGAAPVIAVARLWFALNKK